MATCTKMEFVVQMTDASRVAAIRDLLSDVKGLKLVSIDPATEQVVVETTLAADVVQSVLEQTGSRAVLQGVGTAQGSPRRLGAAVAMLFGDQVKGVVRLTQLDESTCLFDATIDGLSPASYGLFLHEYGDVSDGCDSCGDVMASVNCGGQMKPGQIAVFTADVLGRASFRVNLPGIVIWELIGRSLIVHDSTPSDCRVACGIVARSSGLFENSKRVCACDGVSIWDERDVPIVGPGRSQGVVTARL